MSRHIRSILDLTKDEIDGLFERALEIKQRHAQGIVDRSLRGKTLGLIFDKPSTRTRVSFEAAMAQLGGTSLYISAKDTQIVRNEPIKDTARVLSGYLDGLAIRTYSQAVLEEFAAHAAIPVINALTDRYHPCQVLSDLLTVIEHKGGYRGLKIAWVGDGNNMAHSWINAAGLLGFDLFLACPREYTPDAEILERAADASDGVIRLSEDPHAAVDGADVVNTDVWASMGQEEELEGRKRIFAPYQVDADLMTRADSEAIVMHCLPAHREEEISDEVLEGPSSVVWDQAENKMHMAKAILEWLVLV